MEKWPTALETPEPTRRRNRRDAGTDETPEPISISERREERGGESSCPSGDLYDRLIAECKKRGYDVNLMLGLARVLPNIQFAKVGSENRPSRIIKKGKWK